MWTSHIVMVCSDHATKVVVLFFTNWSTDFVFIIFHCVMCNVCIILSVLMMWNTCASFIYSANVSYRFNLAEIIMPTSTSVLYRVLLQQRSEIMHHCIRFLHCLVQSWKLHQDVWLGCGVCYWHYCNEQPNFIENNYIDSLLHISCKFTNTQREDKVLTLII